MTTIEVTGCFDCPFCVEDTETLLVWNYRCDAKPKYKENMILDTTETPSWCPLNEGEIVVKKIN